MCQDARAAKTYRDELDVLRERAEKVDKLEAELLRYIGIINIVILTVVDQVQGQDERYRLLQFPRGGQQDPGGDQGDAGGAAGG